MGIYIKGMGMPTDWYSCPFSNGAAGCKLQANIVCAKVYKDHTCPLIPVPDHGRLIDADKLPLEEKVPTVMMHDGEKWLSAYELAMAPTVLPADRDGAE